MKLGDKVYVVKKLSRYVATVTEGTVIGASDVDVVWFDDSGLTSCSPVCDVFETKEAADAHKAAVTTTR